jgi:hypothetical protein
MTDPKEEAAKKGRCATGNCYRFFSRNCTSFDRIKSRDPKQYKPFQQGFAFVSSARILRYTHWILSERR